MLLSTTDPGDPSLTGYMVAPREDTRAPLDGNVAYVGSWKNGANIKLLCNKVSKCTYMYVSIYAPYNRMSAVIICGDRVGGS